MRAVAQVIRTAMGNDMSWPTSDGTAEVGELIAQNTTATAADPTFGTVAVVTYKFSSKIVAVPFELLQDSQIDVAAFVENRLVQRIGRITNQFFTTGTGTCAAARRGHRRDARQDRHHRPDHQRHLRRPGRPGALGGSGLPRFRLVSLHDGRQLAEGRAQDQGQPEPSGVPARLRRPGRRHGRLLLGYAVQINQDVATMAANAKSIRSATSTSTWSRRDGAHAVPPEDSAYAKLGQVGFLMWHRAGGNLLDTAAVKYYANSAT